MARLLAKPRALTQETAVMAHRPGRPLMAQMAGFTCLSETSGPQQALCR